MVLSTLTLILIKYKFNIVMKKLLLILLIFLMLGSVSAQDDLNATADNILKDTQYTGDVDDDEGVLEVEQNSYIPVEVKVDEAWSLNVLIDRQPSQINGEYENTTDSHADIPTSRIVDGEEVPLDLGNHRIVYEFKFTNTTSIYRPEAYVSDNAVFFNFELIRTIKNPQNAIYKFNSQFNMVKATEPITTTLKLDDIDITLSDTMFFSVRGLTNAKASIYLDDEFFTSYEVDENSFEEELATSNLAVGSYNLVCIIETGPLRGEYNVTGDTSDSELKIKYTRTKSGSSQNRYITIINTTLNVNDIPDLNPINIDAPPINITYTKSVPVRFEGDGTGEMVVYIDGEKIYNNTVMFSWENPVYIPTKDNNGEYFKVGAHDLSFEITMDEKYERFKPDINLYDNVFYFNFFESVGSSTYLNDKYIITTTLNIKDKNTGIVEIDSDDTVTITRTNDINIEIDGLNEAINLTVYVDDVELYDENTRESSIAVKTFTPRSSIDDVNERDIKAGNYKLRFEFQSLKSYDVEAEYKNNKYTFKFKENQNQPNPDGMLYQLNTTLIVKEKASTVHIKKVKNNTYFDDTEFVVKMDLYKPEDEDEWDDDEGVENPIGTQDVGIIVTRDGKTLYKGDDLMNIYLSNQYNYDFENERLPSAGTYTLKIINLADNTYDTASFTVKKENRVFNRKYSTDDFNVLFTIDFSACNSDLNDLFTIEFDNQEKEFKAKKSSGNNKREVLFTDIDPGTYTATFTLKGNGIYNDATVKSKVTVKKEAPVISTKSNGNKLDITLDIPKSKTSAVLAVSAGGVEKKFTVDRNTKHLTVSFDELGSGSHNVDIEFMGNERYTSKTLTDDIYISHSYNEPDREPVTEEGNNDDNPGSGDGSNSDGDGIGTGTGDSNSAGSGNGTYNGRMSSNARGFNGDLGSQGSGHGDGDGSGVKSYEITKNITKNEASYALLIFLIIAFALLFISFLYERRDEEEEEY